MVRAAGVEKHTPYNAKLVLMGLFTVLWLLDTLATVSFVNQYGLTAEANPLMRAVIATGGAWLFGLCKGMVLCFWLSVGRRAHVAIHWALVAIMTPVVYMGVQMAWGL